MSRIFPSSLVPGARLCATHSGRRFVFGLIASTAVFCLAPAFACAQQQPAAVTYSHGVAQVLQKNCVSCHNPTGGAPFNLQTYADAKQWGGQILDVTQSRYMPPWLPVPDLHSADPNHMFKGDRRLGDADLESIRRWVSAGMPEGAPSSAMTYDSAAQLQKAGRPDLTLALRTTIHVPASGPDLFFTFALPIPPSAPHTIRAVAIAASDPQAAHSILIGVDEKRTLRSEHPEVLAAGLPGMELSARQTEQFAPDGQLLLWTPDAPVLSADPWTLPTGSDLIITAHIKTTGKAEDLSLKISLYDAKTGRGSLHPLLHLDHDDGLEIASGEREFKTEAALTLKQQTTLTSIYPRAHYAARSMEAWAAMPDGTRRNLLTIEKWDVDWVAIYHFAKPITLPKGATIHMSYLYDNSSNNPHNPSDPPKRITAGHSANEEIGELWLETTGTK